MINKFNIIVGCCAIFFCAASASSFLSIPPASTSFSAIYTATSGGVLPNIPGWHDSSGDFSCSGYSGSQRIVSKGVQPLTAPTQGWPDTCAHLKQWESGNPDGPEQYKEQYDTLRLFIDHCAAIDPQSYTAFGYLDAAIQQYSDDSTRYIPYRNWLISVLYLNTTTPQYFCSCIASIAGTYQYGKYRQVGYLAVLNYLRKYHNPTCWRSGGEKMYAQDSTWDAQHGYDATNLPSLDSLGLGFLLNHQTVVPSNGQLPSQYLASFTSSPNPFNKETTLQFTLNRMTSTTIAVYDELGRLVWGGGRGSSLEAGEHTIHLDASNFPSGTLYARISTGFGEVKTVKLVHEK